MIRRYSFGTPCDTGAVVLSLPEEKGEMPYFDVRRDGERVLFRTYFFHNSSLNTLIGLSFP